MSYQGSNYKRSKKDEIKVLYQKENLQKKSKNKTIKKNARIIICNGKETTKEIKKDKGAYKRFGANKVDTRKNF